ncbi:DEAD/DEAH box helicase [Brevibacillus ruminantium]|uniref:DEAD/DEAH box helicase n=1 Tax=Brevibacillus ruminantium TaxID=2950604 RepID=A0ABY4WIS1_9BACL|nr:DEAD/DEAH box helicase [Brevibacillus ruminantium]USG67050.1 DEAD/DEAH box helicase [Brevibacillus ruminantium]
MTKAFATFGFRPELMQGIQEAFYKEPTPIQAEAIPLIIEGKDVIGQAQTGTGKTAAFLLPILNQLKAGKRDIQALILTPTRELSIQIAKEAEKLGKHLGANVLSLHGGTDIDRQLNKLKETVHIVVGTPGRVLDHMKRASLHFGRISTLVLDEADKMLEMGFLEDVEQVIVNTPQNRQILLFSATMPDQVKKLAQQFMKQPPHIRIESKQKTVETIEQLYYVVNQSDKADALVDLLEQEQPYLCIVFANTQVRVQQLTARLQENGFSASALYGDLSQSKREQLMKQFREIKFQFLVATDIAARGLDVEGVTHVINYDLPNDVESYIHRVGRTGRAGQKGKAISLVSPRQKNLLARFAKATKAPIEEKLLVLGRHLDAGRRERAKAREEYFIELREQKAKEEAKEKDKQFAPIREAIKKKTKVKPGYKKKLARELDELKTQYERNRRREEAKAARKAGKTGSAGKSAGRGRAGKPVGGKSGGPDSRGGSRSGGFSGKPKRGQ